MDDLDQVGDTLEFGVFPRFPARNVLIIICC